MKRLSNFFIIITVFIGLFSLHGCAKKENNVIKIGAILPLSGNAQLIGSWVKNGIDMGVEKINADGGVKGKRLKIIYEDTKSSSKSAVSALNKLKSANNIICYISAQNSVAASLAHVTDREKIIGFFVVANLPGLADLSKWYFRYHVHADAEAKKMAEFAVKKLKKERAALFFINDEYGLTSARAFEKYFLKLGGTIVFKESYNKTGIDFRPQILKLKKTNPEIIYIVGYEQSLAIAVKQMRENAITSILLSNNGFAVPAYLKMMLGAGEGTYCTAPAYVLKPKTEVAKKFIKKYDEKYNELPNFMAAEGYDAINIISTALSKSNVLNNRTIAQMLTTIKSYVGVMGKISMLPNGDVDMPTEIGIVKGLKLIPIKK